MTNKMKRYFLRQQNKLFWYGKCHTLWSKVPYLRYQNKLFWCGPNISEDGWESHFSQAIAREMAGSRQALDRLMEQSRSSLGAGKEQPRSWQGAV